MNLISVAREVGGDCLTSTPRCNRFVMNNMVTPPKTSARSRASGLANS